MIDICLLGLIVLLFAFVAILAKKYDKLLDCITNMSLRVREVEDLANRVDESTGAILHNFQKEFNDFREAYGDAAIEEMKESARAQKAWAEGLNNIMSFGADLHGRGDST